MELIIHHWDTDGITSAALLIKALNLKDYKNMTAPIGEFRFDDRIWNEIKNAERVYILDFNVPSEAEKIKVPTIFIDHHEQPRITNPFVRQINPVLVGRRAPSTSFVVSEYFSFWNAWTALGAVGDLGEGVFKIERVNELLSKDNISKEEALRLVELIDSNYITMDREDVEKAVSILLENETKELLNYEPWIKKVEAIRRAIEDALSEVQERKGFAFVEFESSFNIISKVARKLVWEKGYRGAIVVNRNFHGMAQVYFRISTSMADKVDMRGIIRELRSLGLNAGGKREVLGCICDRDKTEEALEVIEKHLELNI
ncbi:hypothetical protein PNA2_1048 [Pyrococcus sp. NA2]|uniref:DHH family phosphoesterase n=1 Tax=Pyrococcus sp. (strain NA2) TaxID=342949 RepID=UPI000209AA6A|nr:DHH family phosphoesterase [Pyrococcus sp. NA2]AEC51964.1 hypothetical protein PNA2_1048 [Pyrococcus sp. NA2]